MAWSRRRWGRRHQLSFRNGLQARLNAIAANPHAHAVRPELGASLAGALAALVQPSEDD